MNYQKCFFIHGSQRLEYGAIGILNASFSNLDKLYF